MPLDQNNMLRQGRTSSREKFSLIGKKLNRARDDGKLNILKKELEHGQLKEAKRSFP